MSKESPVHLLNEEVARKIAAGEVIDRPAAIVRELLDNAVDSGADSIIVEIEQGGINKIRIIDNGSGMTKEDLKNCAYPHSTSKIASEIDLMNLSTLGFRGEALSSIAAVCRLLIRSGDYALKVSSLDKHIIEPSQPITGTIVQTLSLFENFPARRQFLKRPSTEGLLCKNIFIEKALPRPDISFKLSIDNNQKLLLSKDQSLAQRFIQATGIKEKESLFFELHGSSTGMDTANKNINKQNWRFSLVIGDPSIYRTDKKYMYIYVNGRRINEYSLLQAIEYGCQGYFPNGVHPIAILFAEMDPALVDFNIHPAKKEARFKDINALHHCLSTTIKQFLKKNTLKTLRETTAQTTETKSLFEYNDLEQKNISLNKPDYRSHFFAANSSRSHLNNDITSTFLQNKTFLRNYTIDHSQTPSSLAAEAVKETDFSKPNSSIHYIGQALGVFLIVEKEDILYLIDQHAAHERILYNNILNCTQSFQELLIPYVVETTNENDDIYLESIKAKLIEAGYKTKNCGDGRWEFYSLPARWKGTEKDLSHALLDKKVEPKDVIASLAASSACKAAIKDGYILDDQTATELAEKALSLSDPHCPHGRPIFTTITRKELFEKVRRT